MTIFENYPAATGIWDEMYDQGQVRTPYHAVYDFLRQIPLDELNKKEELAKRLFMSQGITFTVYSSGEGIEKIFPFDIIPRIVTASEWDFVDRGIKQRLKARWLRTGVVRNDGTTILTCGNWQSPHLLSAATKIFLHPQKKWNELPGR